MKHTVPKRHQSRRRSDRRYSAFVRKTTTRILNETKLVPCPKCKQKKLAHHVCPTCGTYRGHAVIKFGDAGTTPKKGVTKVKA